MHTFCPLNKVIHSLNNRTQRFPLAFSRVGEDMGGGGEGRGGAVGERDSVELYFVQGKIFSILLN